MKYGNLSMAAPIYVTRKDAGGETGTYSLSLWMTLLVILLAWFNLIVWGVIGLVMAVLVWL